MKLSILTCTLPERTEFLKRLSNQLTPQLNENVEWLIDPRPAYVRTGEKRNWLMNQAKGDYVCHVDDDDFISPNYVDKILKATESNPDVITFEGDMTTDGKFTANWVIKLGERWEDRGGTYYRFPNHLCPVKRTLALKVKFPIVHYQEDYQWAVGLKDRALLKTSVHIPEKLYHYAFRTQK